MHLMAKGAFNILSPHTLTGQIALWLMCAHAVWATYVANKGNEITRKKFHTYSLIVWMIWLVPYVGGMYIGMNN